MKLPAFSEILRIIYNIILLILFTISLYTHIHDHNRWNEFITKAGDIYPSLNNGKIFFLNEANYAGSV